jgi:hypothetical protein
MMGFLAAVWENVYDLLVEDGSIALGTVIALILVGVWTYVMAPRPDLAAWGGPLLFVLLMGLLLVNLYRTGRAAARNRVSA